jgi:serine O-acetyltransferase
LPDSEAQVIRALLDRIEALEKEVQALGQTRPEPILVGAVPSRDGSHCRLQDRVIEEFLDGSGI